MFAFYFFLFPFASETTFTGRKGVQRGGGFYTNERTTVSCPANVILPAEERNGEKEIRAVLWKREKKYCHLFITAYSTQRPGQHHRKEVCFINGKTACCGTLGAAIDFEKINPQCNVGSGMVSVAPKLYFMFMLLLGKLSVPPQHIGIKRERREANLCQNRHPSTQAATRKSLSSDHDWLH